MEAGAEEQIPFPQQLLSVLSIIFYVIGAVAIIYAIYIWIIFANAHDQEKRTRAKKRFMTVLSSILIIAILTGVLKTIEYTLEVDTRDKARDENRYNSGLVDNGYSFSRNGWTPEEVEKDGGVVFGLRYDGEPITATKEWPQYTISLYKDYPTYTQDLGIMAAGVTIGKPQLVSGMTYLFYDLEITDNRASSAKENPLNGMIWLEVKKQDDKDSASKHVATLVIAIIQTVTNTEVVEYCGVAQIDSAACKAASVATMFNLMLYYNLVGSGEGKMTFAAFKATFPKTQSPEGAGGVDRLYNESDFWNGSGAYEATEPLNRLKTLTGGSFRYDWARDTGGSYVGQYEKAKDAIAASLAKQVPVVAEVPTRKTGYANIYSAEVNGEYQPTQHWVCVYENIGTVDNPRYNVWDPAGGGQIATYEGFNTWTDIGSTLGGEKIIETPFHLSASEVWADFRKVLAGQSTSEIYYAKREREGNGLAIDYIESCMNKYRLGAHPYLRTVLQGVYGQLLIADYGIRYGLVLLK
jgi:hypothetical protein